MRAARVSLLPPSCSLHPAAVVRTLVCALLCSLLCALFAPRPAHAQLVVFPSPFSTPAQPITTTASTLTMPGEFREMRVASESSLRIRPGLIWQTTTGLTGSRYDQAMPLRAQSARLTTGPQLKWGVLELAMPLQAGHEAAVASGDSQWASGAPHMTLALTPYDSIKLEARASTRTDTAAARTSKSKKSVTVSWRHAFNERFALRTGLERSREIVEHSLETSESAQAFAQLSASLPDQWRLVLGGSLYEVVSRSGEPGDDRHKDRSQSLSLSANRPLVNGWRLSGSLSVNQTLPGDAGSAYTSRTGNLRLTRDF